MRWGALLVGVILVVAVLVACEPPPPDPRPNVLVVMSDDQAYSTYNRSLMPTVFSELVDGGVAFDRAYINTPLCCPSRAQTLTGLYEHHSGVTDNQSQPLDRPTIVEAVQAAGYRTMLAGKYLNSESCRPRPEFDRWACVGSTPTDYELTNPIINVDGAETPFVGYQTDVLAGMVNDFVASTPRSQPFFALYTPTTPHTPADDPRHDDLAVEPHRPPSYDADVRTGRQPGYLQQSPMTAAQKAAVDHDHEVMTRAVPSLDDSVQAMLDGLGPRAENTLVVYLSDNGWLYGEHRWKYKVVPYEESVRVPFAIRYPPLTDDRAGTVSPALVQNIDLAPTIADLAGIPWAADGHSLVPLLSGASGSVRDAALIEACDGTVVGCWTPGGRTTRPSMAAVPFYRGIVTDRYKYVEYASGAKELYDLGTDPFEQRSIHDLEATQTTQDELATQLQALIAEPEPDTTLAVVPDREGTDTLARFRWFSQSPLSTYRCRLDVGEAIGEWVSCPGQTLQQTLPPGTYTFSVESTDATGRTDPTPASSTFSIVAGGPDVALTSTPPVLSSGNSATFEFSAPLIDLVARFECRIGRSGKRLAAWSTCTSPQQYSGLGNGTRRFEVRAVDLQGTPTASPAAWLFTLDTVGPRFHFPQVPPAATRATTAKFVINPQDLLSGSASCKLDTGPAQPCSGADAITYTGLSYATHTFTATGVDLAGNSHKTTYSWKVSRTAPTAAVAKPPAD